MNAIVIMAIGEKYQAILHKMLPQFEAYANLCHAKLEICNELPDPFKRGDIFTQKLLLPSLYSEYEWIAFMDLDVLISKNAPSIFSKIDPHKGFGAVLDPRDSYAFHYSNIHWHKQPNLNFVTVESLAKSRGFEANSLFHGTINGGVWLANTKLVGKLFSDFYYLATKNDTNQPIHEEMPMAYLSQTSALFFPLEDKFNKQVIYIVSEKNTTKIYRILKFQKKINKLLRKFLFIKREVLLRGYVDIINDALEKNYIVHFSGNFPMPADPTNQIIYI